MFIRGSRKVGPRPVPACDFPISFFLSHHHLIFPYYCPSPILVAAYDIIISRVGDASRTILLIFPLSSSSSPQPSLSAQRLPCSVCIMATIDTERPFKMSGIKRLRSPLEEAEQPESPPPPTMVVMLNDAIIDGREALIQVVTTVFERMKPHDIPPPPHRIISAFMKQSILVNVYRSLGAGDLSTLQEMQPWVDLHRDAAKLVSNRIQVYSGAKSFLEQLKKRGIPVVLATSRQGFVETFLQHHRMRDLFCGVVGNAHEYVDEQNGFRSVIGNLLSLHGRKAAQNGVKRGSKNEVEGADKSNSMPNTNGKPGKTASSRTSSIFGGHSNKSCGIVIEDAAEDAEVEEISETQPRIKIEESFSNWSANHDHGTPNQISDCSNVLFISAAPYNLRGAKSMGVRTCWLNMMEEQQPIGNHNNEGFDDIADSFDALQGRLFRSSKRIAEQHMVPEKYEVKAGREFENDEAELPTAWKKADDESYMEPLDLTMED